MYGRQSAAGTLISFYAFMLLSIPMLRFVQNTVRSEVQWIPQIWMFLFYGNTILQGIPEPSYFRSLSYICCFLTHLYCLQGCFHDPSSLERIPKDRDSGIESLPESICCAGDQWCTCPHFILDLLFTGMIRFFSLGFFFISHSCSGGCSVRWQMTRSSAWNRPFTKECLWKIA